MVANTVAPSRQGDKFHHYWAARRALRLLSPGTGLAAITVEGRSDQDSEAGSAADQVIDVAEYWGGESPSTATRIVYSQLKHSTTQTDKPWTVSGFSDVFAGFGKIYGERLATGTAQQLEFQIVTNRPVAGPVRDAMQRIINGDKDSAPSRTLRGYVDLDGLQLQTFLQSLIIDDAEEDAATQANLLHQGSGAFVAAASTEAMLRLKEMVTNRAADPNRVPIRREDVLLAFGVLEADLLPAPELFERPDSIVERRAYRDILDRIFDVPGSHLVHAAGGVGKSSFAVWVATAVGANDTVITFDSFGGGSYREPSKARHDHRGVLQIANELAGLGLADPLLPSSSSDMVDYLRALTSRLGSAAAELKTRGGHLLVIVDAADSAVIASQGTPGSVAFPIALLKESMPDNVRVVATARTERLHLLDPEPGVSRHPLPAFDPDETREFLSLTHSGVNKALANQFHSYTWGNPRVQTAALAGQATVTDAIARADSLHLTDAASAFDEFLADGLARLKADYGSQAGSIDAVCGVLACLRPVIQVETLADVADVAPTLVDSILSDFPAPLRRLGNAVHFRDEPTETFFRERLRPAPHIVDDLIARIEPLTASNYYLASSLPQLLWEAGRHEQLISLALSQRALPRSSDTEAREVEDFRARYALRAALSADRWQDAARLALRLGRLGEAGTVRSRLIATNADLAGRVLDLEYVERATNDRSLAIEANGFNLAREGIMLAMRKETRELAPQRMRTAHEWMVAYSKLTRDPDLPPLHYNDLADLILGTTYANGVRTGAELIGRISPSAVFRVTRTVAGQMIDRGHSAQLQELAIASKSRTVALATAAELWDANISATIDFARTLSGYLARSRALFGISDRDQPHYELAVVVAAVSVALRAGTLRPEVAKRLLTLRVTPEQLSRLADWPDRGRHYIALARALIKVIDGSILEPADLASEKLLDAIRRETTTDADSADFKANILPAIAWLNAWAHSIVTPTGVRLAKPLKKELGSAVNGWREPRILAHWILLATTSMTSVEPRLTTVLTPWVARNEGMLSQSALVTSARSLAHNPETTAAALDIIKVAEPRLEESTDGADYRTSALMSIARAVWAADEGRAAAYFLAALDAADLIGDEVHTQWQTTLTLAGHVFTDTAAARDRILPLARAAESLGRVGVLELDHSTVVKAIGRANVTAALALASQWRDRWVGGLDHLLRGLIEDDGDPLTNQPLIRLVLAPIIRRDTLGEIALAAVHAGSDPERVLQYAEAASRRDGIHPGNDIGLRELASQNGASLNAQPTPRWERDHNVYSDRWLGRDDNTREATIAAGRRRLKRRALDNPSDIADALASATWENGLRVEDVIEEGLSPSRRHKWASFIDGLASLDSITTFDARALLERLASLSLDLPTQRSARAAADSVADRFARELTTKSYDSIEYRLLASISQRTEHEIRADALRRMAATDESLTVDEAYALATKLAALLEPEHAAVVLDDAIEQFRPIMRAAEETVPAVHFPLVEQTLSYSIAGLLWTALADPDEHVRWEAAHCIRAALALAEPELMFALAARAARGTPDEFVDPELVFYLYNAQHFLLLALHAERGLSAADPTPFQDFLTGISRERHYLLTPLANDLLHAMGEAGGAWEPKPTRVKSWTRRRKNSRGRYDRPDTDYRFDWDFRENMLEGLADAMDLDRVVVEKAASDVITLKWSRPERGEGIKDDVRHVRGDFRNRQTSERYATPRVQDLDYYLSFHAAMVLAADLVHEHAPLMDSRQDTVDELTRWAQRFIVTGEDGTWLSDRRMPAPAIADTSGPSDAQDWRWAVTGDHFHPYLFASDGLDRDWVTIWASFSADEHDRDENVRVSSVLVRSDTATALVSSLQVDRNSHDLYLPSQRDVDDDDDSDAGDPFIMWPWIRLDDAERSIDWGDPRGSGLPSPPPRPATTLSKSLVAARSIPREEWTDDGNTVMIGESWLSGQRRSREGYAGKRLMVSRRWLDEMLTATGRVVVATVTIDRDLRGYQRERSKLDQWEHLSDYVKAFQYRPGTEWIDYRGLPQPRP